MERLFGFGEELLGLRLLLGLTGSSWSTGSMFMLVFCVMSEVIVSFGEIVDSEVEGACRGQLLLYLGFLLRLVGSGVVVADGGVEVRFCEPYLVQGSRRVRYQFFQEDLFV